MNDESKQVRRGRIVAVMIAGIGLGWIGVLALGDALGWSQRTLAFFDLAALAGFGMALWLVYGIWRSRRNSEGPDAKD
ncbi:DUF5337 domain-containing protein [Pararhodobacter sp.]|uniref:DUF5337 domain-containing protein n=1 Tax=Pararhodobacter sp. TaxID=2127056 RepID=UPI002AFE32DE|nr:DUF5337 domain-containing protein [Pararhodobacter sp.]